MMLYKKSIFFVSMLQIMVYAALQERYASSTKEFMVYGHAILTTQTLEKLMDRGYAIKVLVPGVLREKNSLESQFLAGLGLYYGMHLGLRTFGYHNSNHPWLCAGLKYAAACGGSFMVDPSEDYLLLKLLCMPLACIGAEALYRCLKGNVQKRLGFKT